MKKEVIETVASYAKEHRENPTRAEKIFKNALDDFSISYINQFIAHTKSNMYILDFVIDIDNLPLDGGDAIDVEIDGGYHNTDEQIKKDNDRANDLFNNSEYSFQTVRFTNEEIEAFDKVFTFLKCVKKRMGGYKKCVDYNNRVKDIIEVNMSDYYNECDKRITLVNENK